MPVVDKHAVHAGLWLCLPLLACAGCSACSGDDRSSAEGGSGGAPVDAAVEAVASGGAGGLGGSGGQHDASIDSSDADSGIVEPIWEAFGEVGGITFEHLKNADALRLFRWTPCPEVQNCEVAEFVNPALYGNKPNVQPRSIANDDGTAVRAAIGLDRSDYGFAVAVDDDGRVLEGYRCQDPGGVCNLMMPGLWGKRFVVNVLEGDATMRHAVFGSFDSLPGKPTLIDASGMTGGGPGERVLGETRFSMRWAPIARLVSVSAVDGSDLRQYAAVTSDGSIFEIGSPDTTGSHFVFDELIDIGGEEATRISISDGVSPAVPYIVPGPGEYAGSPRFAHSHIGWLRATGMISTNKYEKVELWASPYTPNPAQLEPFKAGDVPITQVSIDGVGGYGRYGLIVDAHTVQIWDLPSKSMLSRTLPSFMKVLRFVGVTRTHLWMTGTDPNGTNRGDWLVRFTVQ